jgi:hypothetical protein
VAKIEDYEQSMTDLHITHAGYPQPCRIEVTRADSNDGGEYILLIRGKYSSERVSKHDGKNYAFLDHSGRIYL